MKASFEHLFFELGLGRNEAKVYEALLKHGESSVTDLAEGATVHRRNVYDVLHRLREKGLVSEVVLHKKSAFRAVDPSKLRELLFEQEQHVRQILPKLHALQVEKRERQQAFLYRDIEGYKNYLRDILRIGADVDVLGAKASWLDERVREFLPWFSAETTKRKLKFRFLFDNEALRLDKRFLEVVPGKYRFLPKGYSSRSCVDVFGDHVMVAAPLSLEKLERHFSVTVVVDRRLACSFRTWFDLMWRNCEETSTHV